MVFSSVIFLGIFLPLSLIGYFIMPGRTGKNIVLLIFSLMFYAWGEPKWVFIMAALTFADYLFAMLMDKVNKKGLKVMILSMAVISNLSLLFIVKYYNFFVSAVNGGINLGLPEYDIRMPVGISFFTFQALTYVVDVYRKDARVQKNYFYLLLYISMFPQLIAGPIVRYSDIDMQITDRTESMRGFVDGMFRFSIGLGKKVMFANYAGNIATQLLEDSFNGISAAAVWIGVFMFTMQIYFDFSGYSDMAIGLGKIFGFDYKENFNYPYIADSISDFWRRWHISLSTFFRDYVYIPLGGNRKHHMLNIMIVWFLTGLWHGASWNFIIWGLFYGILLIVEKKLKNIGIDISKVPVFGNILVLIIIVYSMALFYFVDFGRMVQATYYMLGIGNRISLGIAEKTIIYKYLWSIPVMVVACTPIPKKAASKIFKKETVHTDILQSVMFAAVYILCFILILNQTYNPFLYFRF